MSKERLETGKTPSIYIDQCEGDLSIRGWSEPAIEPKGEYQLEKTDEGYRLSGSGSLRINVPMESTISIGRVRGSLSFRQVVGAFSCDYVQGDVSLSHTGDSSLGVVHGDLSARNTVGAMTAAEVNGDVALRGVGGATFNAIHGDLSARIINGDVRIDSIHGDADLRTIEGDVTVAQGFRDINLAHIAGLVNVTGVTGDIRLRTALAGGDHRLEARGDIVVRWPVDAPLNLEASGPQIDNRLRLEDLLEEKERLTGRIGKGDVNLALKASGRIVLREAESAEEQWSAYGKDMEFDLGFDMTGIAARIETEMNNHLARVTRDLETKFGAEFGQRMSEKFARKSEKAAERGRRRVDTRGRPSGGADFSSAQSGAARKASSTEEQLKILKMVETGKITPEEAGMLLEALEN